MSENGRPSSVASAKGRYDTYWKLPADETLGHELRTGVNELRDKVEALGITRFSNDSSYHRGAQWYHSSLRELPVYETCSNRELYRFARDRKIAFRPKRVFDERIRARVPNRRLGAMGALEAADRNPSFHRFLDLIPEHRNAIYEMYISEFEDVLLLPTKPPLARVCHQIRDEFLSVFYHKVTVEIPFQSKYISTPFRETNETKLFLHHMRPQDFKHLTNFIISISEPYYGIFLNCAVSLNVKDSQGGFHVRVVGDDDGENWQYIAACEIEKHANQAAVEGGKRVFGLQDFLGVRGVLEHAYNLYHLPIFGDLSQNWRG